MLIRIWIERTQPLAGAAATEESDPVHFDGWLELLSVLSELVAATGGENVRAMDRPVQGDQTDSRKQGQEAVMAQTQDAQATQPPGPDPALKRLDWFVGTWEIKGRTLDSEQDNVSGRTTFEWLPGGFFLHSAASSTSRATRSRGLRSSATTPLVLGSGRRLFPDGGPWATPQLLDGKPTTTGVVVATYQPAEPTAGTTK
jgi:hypothetical protein